MYRFGTVACDFLCAYVDLPDVLSAVSTGFPFVPGGASCVTACMVPPGSHVGFAGCRASAWLNSAPFCVDCRVFLVGAGVMVCSGGATDVAADVVWRARLALDCACVVVCTRLFLPLHSHGQNTQAAAAGCSIVDGVCV